MRHDSPPAKTPQPDGTDPNLVQSIDAIFAGQTLEDVADSNLQAAMAALAFLEEVLLTTLATPELDMGEPYAQALHNPAYRQYWPAILFWSCKMLGDSYISAASMVGATPVYLLSSAIDDYRRNTIEEVRRLKAQPTQ